jgi:hypothetical protein
MGVDVAPDRLELGLESEDGFNESHFSLPVLALPAWQCMFCTILAPSLQ